MTELRENILLRLLVFLIAALLIGTAVLWYVGLTQNTLVINYILLFFGLLFFIMFTIILLVMITLLIYFRQARLPAFLRPLLKVTLSRILPFAFLIGKACKIPADKLQKSFVNISNHIVENQGIKLKPEEVIVLAPHCLQLATCQYKVTHNVDNCKRCGQCQIRDLIEICEKRGVELKVVTGGTLARKVVKESRPKAILAIACERDLSSGIKDISPLPVYGVFNIRPNGPCFNTKVDLEKVEQALDAFLTGGDLQKITGKDRNHRQ